MEHLTVEQVREEIAALRAACERERWAELAPLARLGDLRKRQWFTLDGARGQVVQQGPGSVAVRFRRERQIVVDGEVKARIKSWQTTRWSPETAVLPRTTERRGDK
jgi:hypothetical protein